MKSNKTNTRSFSLVELMIVITIIALLAAAGIPNYVNYIQRAAVMETVQTLAQYRSSIATFWSIELRLPQAGDTLQGAPTNLTFGVQVNNTTATPLPDTIQSLLLSASGNGVIITAVVQGNVFSTVATNNRTLVLGAMVVNGNTLQFQCGNFTPNAALITDIGFTPISVLPTGCNYNGVSTWLGT